MKVYSVILYSTRTNPPHILTQVTDLSTFGFFKRGTVKEFILFVSRELVGRTGPGERQSVTHTAQESSDPNEKFVCHCYVNLKELGGVIITDGEYPARVAYSMMLKAMEELTKSHGADVTSRYTTDANLSSPEIEGMLAKYQQPEQVDSVLKIEKDLDETKGILIKSIDQLLVRGEKLEDLAAKSQDLSFQSKAFMKKSQDLNSCCTII